jgi:hypothetical protein
LLEDFIESDILVPLARESTDMAYSASEMSASLGDLQNKIRMKNLVENYIMILLLVFTMVALISMTNASKFILFMSQTNRHIQIDDYLVDSIERAEEKFEERAKSKDILSSKHSIC